MKFLFASFLVISLLSSAFSMEIRDPKRILNQVDRFLYPDGKVPSFENAFMKGDYTKSRYHFPSNRKLTEKVKSVKGDKAVIKQVITSGKLFKRNERRTYSYSKADYLASKGSQLRLLVEELKKTTIKINGEDEHCTATLYINKDDEDFKMRYNNHIAESSPTINVRIGVTCSIKNTFQPPSYLISVVPSTFFIAQIVSYSREPSIGDTTNIFSIEKMRGPLRK